jgi:hypothetical protein
MSDTYRLKTKVGPHEFEAEGPQKAVQEQFKAFMEFVKSSPAPVDEPSEQQPRDVPPPSQQSEVTQLDRIMHVEGRIVSLTVRPDSIEDGVLLLMYGQKMLRANDAVTGSELMSGLTHTGQRVTRVDKTLVKASDKGDVIVLGAGRAKRYRLTNAGLAKAKDLAASQIARVA